ncbi:MAG: GDSL-type esterase/lipase family protein [Acutalibacteraceae bacterium]|jgi:lysophospholipase L1-like esterase
MKVKSKAFFITIFSFVALSGLYFIIIGTKNGAENFKAKGDTTKISSKTTCKNYDYSTPVQESKQASSDYFDDAVFFGDSLTYGMIGNFFVDDENIIACKGASIKAMTGKVTLSGKEDKGVVNAIGKVVEQNPKKIYIMLGINGLAWMTTQQVIDDYEELIDKMKLANPNAKIYIQSIFPVSEYKNQSDNRYDNLKINKINNALLNLACKKEVYYLDTNSLLKDEAGNLSNRFTNIYDGIHINKDAYNLWYDYLCNHTV